MKTAVIAEVDGELWDLPRPLEKDCKLKILTFDDDKGKQVFWHSSAHVLGESCENHYGCHLCIGPPLTDGGFYYEMGMAEKEKMNGFDRENEAEDRTVQPADWPALEELCRLAIKEKQVFIFGYFL